MTSDRDLFYKHIARTSPAPLGIEVSEADKVWVYSEDGKRYLDLISGISVSAVGHRHPEIVKAIYDQLDKYLHVMVYGEFIMSPQVKLAEQICKNLPASLNNVFFVNSGSEAVEGAIKLAKRATGRTKIVSFKNGYHGSTHGALSIMGCEALKNSFRPLLPDVHILDFNDISALDNIDNSTACVVIETIQGEGGAIVPDVAYMKALRKKCSDKGALLILDEVQCGIGRTGKLWAFEHYDIIPDVLVMAKGLGGGLPLGAFVAPKELMQELSHKPVLGHISTFGGNPLCCAAAYANMNIILRDKLYQHVLSKEKIFRQYLQHPLIKSVNGKGLLLAVEFQYFEQNKRIIGRCIQKGVITDWFLFAPNSLRIAPPLIITDEQIKEGCKLILEAIDEVGG